jgi:anthranilate synthase component 1
LNNIVPSLEEFRALARDYNVIPVYREIIVDRVTPVSVYERLSAGEDFSFLLESVEGDERLGRYSFVGRRPHATFICRKNNVVFQEGKMKRSWTTANPVQDLKKIFSAFRTPELPGHNRFIGGAVGYWDYDTVRYFEKLPDSKPDALGFPQGAFQFTGELVVFDRFSQTARVYVNVFIPDNSRDSDVIKLYHQAARAIDAQIRTINKPLRPKIVKHRGTAAAPEPLTVHEEYLQSVEKAKEYIKAGDIIQVVLSQRWQLVPGVRPFQVYRALRILNPSPYMYCLHFPGMDIIGSSPELLVRKEGQTAETCPIAGTRPRGETQERDQELAEELKTDPKERAEHLMLVDLGRNDLGRVCEPGSVKVSEFMRVERYSHVMHLVSSVTGRLSPLANAFDLMQACFPAGTLSGAPKIRAMEIIDELEPFRRGPYGGCLGYFSYNGNMDMAITIRTMVLDSKKAYIQAGGGIVADSIPENEYQECRHKAAALFAAVEKAGSLE